MHCHNDFHARSGMFMQVVEAPLALQNALGLFSIWARNNALNWKFLVRFWAMDDKKMPWLYQTISKAFEAYGYAGLTYFCNPSNVNVTENSCNYPSKVTPPA